MKDEQAEGQQEAALPGERLARFLAHAGVASRRHAEELIATGHVQVNGTTITTQGTRIDPRARPGFRGWSPRPICPGVCLLTAP